MHSSFYFSILKRALVTASSLLLGVGLNAHAVVINFDDLTLVSDPVMPCFCDHPLTDEYLAQGLRISEGFLGSYYPSDSHIVSSPNYLLGGQSLSLSFVGELPTFVSMYVTAPRQDAAYITASGPGGWSEEKQTPGWAGPFLSTPWEPKQFISFESATGIARIDFWSWYYTRTSVDVDDLTYEYASVPEPSSLALLVMSLLGVVCFRKMKAASNIK